MFVDLPGGPLSISDDHGQAGSGWLHSLVAARSGTGDNCTLWRIGSIERSQALLNPDQLLSGGDRVGDEPAKRASQGTSIRKPSNRVPLHGTDQHTAQTTEVPTQPGRATSRLIPRKEGADRLGILLGEERGGRGKLVEHRSQTEEVCCRPHRLSVRLLWCHIAPGAPNLALALPPNEGLGDAEVQELDHPLGIDHQVGGLDVSVHQVERAALLRHRSMGMGKSITDLPSHLRDEIEAQRDAVATTQAQDPPQGDPLDVLHHQVVAAILTVEVLDLDQILMLQQGADAGLVGE